MNSKRAFIRIFTTCFLLLITLSVITGCKKPAQEELAEKILLDSKKEVEDNDRRVKAMQKEREEYEKKKATKQ
jgi:hypothetical protein